MLTVILELLLGACIIMLGNALSIVKALLRYMKDKGYELPTNEEIHRYVWPK